MPSQDGSGHEVIDEERARVWSQTTVKVNMGDYENIEISMGASMVVENSHTAIRTTQRRLMREHKRLLAAEAATARESRDAGQPYG